MALDRVKALEQKMIAKLASLKRMMTSDVRSGQDKGKKPIASGSGQEKRKEAAKGTKSTEPSQEKIEAKKSKSVAAKPAQVQKARQTKTVQETQPRRSNNVELDLPLRSKLEASQE